jgi:hypothetical protein
MDAHPFHTYRNYKVNLDLAQEINLLYVCVYYSELKDWFNLAAKRSHNKHNDNVKLIKILTVSPAPFP